MGKITLTQEKETLLIPLYGKAMDYQAKNSLLGDKKAAEIVSRIDYDFSRLNIQNKTNLMMCMRAGMLDDITKEYLGTQKNSLVLHLGCGLDSRCIRAGQKAAAWYDVDFPEVIEIRKAFFAETKTYHLVGSSVTQAGWIETIPNSFENVLVIAEGLMMYLKEAEIKTLISRLKSRFSSFEMVMDVYSRLTAKSAKNHPSIKKTGVNEFWGMDDPKTLETWNLGMAHQRTVYFTEYNLERLKPADRRIFSLANRFKLAKNAHRIEMYRVG